MVRTTPAICNLGLSDLPDPLDGIAQRADAFERQELRLQRHQHGIDRDQRVQGHQAERGRAVDQDGVPALARVVALGVERIGQAVLAPLDIDQLDLGAGELDVGRHDRQAGDLGLADCLVERDEAEQEFVGTGRAIISTDAQAGRGIALGI